jgi:YbbR domain-containing protein
VDNISSVQTDPIDLATITGPTTLRVNAFVPQRQTHFETSPVVTVELDVERTEIKK